MESFLCGGVWVDFSNDAAESLFESWEQLARVDPSRPGMAAVAAYLRRSLDRAGSGNRAFGMDRELLPGELAGPAELAALLAVVERTAAEPTLVPDVNWSPELIEWWRERLVRMAEALRAVVGQSPESGQ